MASAKIGLIDVSLNASCYDNVRLKNMDEVLHILGDGDGFKELGEANVKKIPGLISDIFPYGLGITACTFEDKNQEKWSLTLIPRRDHRLDHTKPNQDMMDFHNFNMKPSVLFKKLEDSWNSDKIFVLDHYTIALKNLYHILPCKIKCDQILMNKNTLVMVKDLQKLDADPETKAELANWDYAALNTNGSFIPTKTQAGRIVTIDPNLMFPIEVKFHGKAATEWFIMEDLAVFGDTNLQ